MTRQEVGGGPDDMDLDDGGINDSLEESLKESNVTELYVSLFFTVFFDYSIVSFSFLIFFFIPFHQETFQSPSSA